MTTLPTLEQIISLQKNGLEVGGSPGLRDKGALEGALGAVESAMGYVDMTTPECAALLVERLAKAHAFVDGNKRISALAYLLTLSLNGWEFKGNQADFAIAIIKTADTGTFDTKMATFCSKSVVVDLLFKYDTGEWKPGI